MAFCRNCGSQIGDDERFCPNCGQGVEAPIPAPEKAAPAGPNIFTNLLGFFKNLFSGDPLGGALKAAQSNGLEWTIIAGTFVIVFALGAMATFPEFLRTFINVFGRTSAAGIKVGKLVKYGAVFGLSIVAAVFIYGVVLGAAFLRAKVISRLKVSFFGVANLVAYATIPVIAVLAVNTVMGLVWMPVAIAFLLAAIFIQIKIIDVGLRDLNEGKETNFFLLAAVYVTAAFLVLLTAFIVYFSDYTIYFKSIMF